MYRRLLVVLFALIFLGSLASVVSAAVVNQLTLPSHIPLTWDCYQNIDCRPNFTGTGGDWGTCIRTCWQPPEHPETHPAGLLRSLPSPTSPSLPPLPPSCTRNASDPACNPSGVNGAATAIRLMSPTSATIALAGLSYKVEWRTRGISDDAPISISAYYDGAAANGFSGRVYHLVQVGDGIKAGDKRKVVEIPPRFYGPGWKVWVKVHDPDDLSKVVTGDISDTYFSIDRRGGDAVVPLSIISPDSRNLAGLSAPYTFSGSNHPDMSGFYNTYWQFVFTDSTFADFPTPADIQVGNNWSPQFTTQKGTFINTPGIFNVALTLNHGSAYQPFAVDRPTGVAYRTYLVNDPRIFKWEDNISNFLQNFPEITSTVNFSGTGGNRVMIYNTTPNMPIQDYASLLTKQCNAAAGTCTFSSKAVVGDFYFVAYAEPGYKLLRWEGDCASAGANNICGIVAAHNPNVTAVFGLCTPGEPGCTGGGSSSSSSSSGGTSSSSSGGVGTPAVLTVAISPTNPDIGEIKLTGALGGFENDIRTCTAATSPCQIRNDAMFNEWGMLRYQVQALPKTTSDPDARFVRWFVDAGQVRDDTRTPFRGDWVEDTANIIDSDKIAVITQDATIRGVFTNQYTLTINCNSCFIQTAPIAWNLTGDTFGSFTLEQVFPAPTQPPLVCQNTPCSRAYPANAQVKVTAAPAPPRHVVSWTGDCALATASHPTPEVCILTMNANKAAGAGFVYNPITDYTLSSAGLDEGRSETDLSNIFYSLNRLAWVSRLGVGRVNTLTTTPPNNSAWVNNLPRCNNGLPNNPFPGANNDPASPCCALQISQTDPFGGRGFCETLPNGTQQCVSEVPDPTITCMRVRYPASYNREWLNLTWGNFTPAPVVTPPPKYIPTITSARTGGYQKSQNYKYTVGNVESRSYYLGSSGLWASAWSQQLSIFMHSLRITHVTGAGKVTVNDPSIPALVSQLGSSQNYCGIAPCQPSATWTINTTTTPQTRYYTPKTITLTAATTSPDISFLGWTGDCASFGTSTTCTLTMGQNPYTAPKYGSKEIGANFGIPIVLPTKYRCDQLPGGGGTCVRDDVNGSVIPTCPASCTPIGGLKYRCDQLPGGGGTCVRDDVNGSVIPTCPASCTPVPVPKYRCQALPSGAGSCVRDDQNGSVIPTCPASCTPPPLSCTAQAGVVINSLFYATSTATADQRIVYRVGTTTGSTGPTNVSYTWQGDGQSGSNAQRTVEPNFYTTTGSKTTTFTVRDDGFTVPRTATCSANINITGQSGPRTLTVNNISGDGLVNIYKSNGSGWLIWAICREAYDPDLPCTPANPTADGGQTTAVNNKESKVQATGLLAAIYQLLSGSTFQVSSTCTVTFAAGEQARLEAVPDAGSPAPNNSFLRWVWNGLPLAGSNTVNPFSPNLTQDRSLCVEFGSPQTTKYRCDQLPGGGGTCVPDPNGEIISSCPSSCTPSGLNASCTVMPRSGDTNTVFTWSAQPRGQIYTYLWQGQGFSGNTPTQTVRYSTPGNYSGSVTVTDQSSSRSQTVSCLTDLGADEIVVTQAQPDDRTVRVRINGGEKGTVSVNGDLIPCTGICEQSFTYDLDTSVRIVADINDSTRDLVTWGEDCSSERGLSCILAMSQNRYVTINFGQPDFNVEVSGGTGNQGIITYDGSFNRTMNPFDTDFVTLKMDNSGGYNFNSVSLKFGTENDSWGKNPNPKPLNLVMCDGITCFEKYPDGSNPPVKARWQPVGSTQVEGTTFDWLGNNLRDVNFRLRFNNRAQESAGQLSPYRHDPTLQRQLIIKASATISGQEGQNINLGPKDVTVRFRYLDSQSTP